jgi:hypothetical protein
VKRLPLQISGFLVASAATAWVWHSAFKTGNSRPELPAATHPENHRVEIIDIRAWRADLAAATTAEAKLQAARRLDRFPANRAREALEETTLIEGRQLTLEAKLLLIRWASDDGESAMQWAWLRFRSEDVWNESFREIISAWSWNQPAKLAAWAKRMAALSESPGSHISRTDAEQSDHPILDSDGMRRIAKNLARVSPRDAIGFLVSPGGSAGWDSDLPAVLSFTSTSALREALDALEDATQLDWDLVNGGGVLIDQWPNNRPTPEAFAISMLQHWNELDPEDFQRSRFADRLPAPPDPPALPQTTLHRGWVGEFLNSSWPSPGVTPEMKDWPEEKIEAWKDHHALMHGNGN